VQYQINKLTVEIMPPQNKSTQNEDIMRLAQFVHKIVELGIARQKTLQKM